MSDGGREWCYVNDAAVNAMLQENDAGVNKVLMKRTAREAIVTYEALKASNVAVSNLLCDFGVCQSQYFLLSRIKLCWELLHILRVWHQSKRNLMPRSWLTKEDVRTVFHGECSQRDYATDKLNEECCSEKEGSSGTCKHSLSLPRKG
ncbi:hypothetical protein NL676_007921 [Syzygium grande]|nr:hypothetical protein NL676_007921 [Syzygium grande]